MKKLLILLMSVVSFSSFATDGGAIFQITELEKGGLFKLKKNDFVFCAFVERDYYISSCTALKDFKNMSFSSMDGEVSVMYKNKLNHLGTLAPRVYRFDIPGVRGKAKIVEIAADTKISMEAKTLKWVGLNTSWGCGDLFDCDFNPFQVNKTYFLVFKRKSKRIGYKKVNIGMFY